MEGRGTFLFCSCAMYFFITCTAVDTITRNQTIRDGQTIISAGQYFELGFFSPGSSTKRYLGIWYKKIATGTVVWVANRDSPLNDTSGTLRITEQGILALYNSSNSQIWSMNASRSVNNPVAQLLDTGNLVLKNENENDNDPEDFIWQSFDYPGDTSLPGTKLGTDFVTGLDRYLTSWISVDDPSPGEYKIWMDINGYPQIFQGKGSVIESRLGPWNGLRFTGLPSLKPNPIYTYKFVFNQKEVYYEFNLINSSVVTKLTLTPDGNSERLNWIDRKQGWLLYLSPETDSCTRYGLCGPYGSCNIDNSPACGCLKRFIPRSPEEWSIADWSGGCTRRMALDCGEREGFRKYSGLKLPDTRGSWFNESMNLAECEKMCKKNCSCTAYSNLDIRGRGSGCLLWFGDLIDIREFSENGQDIYIRMAASELEKDGSSRVKKLVTIIVIPVVLTLSAVIGLCLVCVIKKRKLMRVGEVEEAEAYNKGSRDKDLELPLFSLSTLYKATNSFWITNKVGEGGYGPVYKGVLEDGKEIAVKRLSKTSTQGLEEFTNEVICISKLQHRNLVKLLGCCIEGEENMLVYEYMPNKSLDSFIFDKTRSKLLDWPKRFHIINGIARGLLYLHQDSILRIIHRDLKAGNILLDFEMEPKISDFGTARSFGGNETDTNTKKVVGTYGYMSPEYAGDGIFSIKSDVFSFGVLVLEIVSGKRNNGFCQNDLNGHNLIGHAWVLHKEGRSSELFDPSISDSFQEFEMLRSIQVGLLCVQQSPRDRPTMASVVLMLRSEGALSEPQQPGFFNEKSILESECSLSTYPPYSTNETAITVLEPR